MLLDARNRSGQVTSTGAPDALESLSQGDRDSLGEALMCFGS
jgi:hypothetical protein